MACGCKKIPKELLPKPTRDSCIECVEKHFGAAYVLLSETHDGHCFRLRAIGHLHEAADESQSWPELHQALRSARRAYQGEGLMPDWESISRMIAEVRNAE